MFVGYNAKIIQVLKQKLNVIQINLKDDDRDFFDNKTNHIVNKTTQHTQRSVFSFRWVLLLDFLQCNFIFRIR